VTSLFDDPDSPDEVGETGPHVIVEADGGSRGNPGPAGYGAVVFDARSGEVLAERFDYIGIDTNNVAEYKGLIAGLQAASELGAQHVAVRMDSKLVIEQMAGRWQVKHPSMRPLAREAAALLARFPETTLEWIPREINKHADHLANRAMDQGTGKTPAPARKAPAAVAPAAPAAGSWTPPKGTPTRMILLRHGSTEHSPQMRYSGRNDLPLSELGLRQAAAFAGRVANFAPIDAVLSSPLPRTRMTADAAAAALSLPVELRDGLIETDFGAWEGFTGEEVRERWPAEYAAWLASPETAPPGGESFDTVGRRVRRERDHIIAAYPGQTVLVVSHVTPIKCLLTSALDAPASSMFRLHLDTASVSVTYYYPNGISTVRLVNDTSHLLGI
jgi:broad specificity phosphatase PhoE/ribonuclease HI